MLNRTLVMAALLLAAALAQSALGAIVMQPHSRAQLIVAPADRGSEGSVTVGLRLQLDRGWHVYWKNPGDAGMATSVAWQLPAGISAGALQWPTPERIDTGPITSYGYSDEVILLTALRIAPSVAQESVTLKATADWLVCKEICIPASAELSVGLSEATPASGPLIEATRARLPRAIANWSVEANQRDGELIMRVQPPAGRLTQLAFIPLREGDIDDNARQEWGNRSPVHELTLRRPAGAAPLERIAGLLIYEQDKIKVSREIDLPVGSAPPRMGASISLAVALAFAFLGGLILNLMPCVFPVLAIKILGVLERVDADKAKLRAHGLLFALGTQVAFLGIAGLLLWLRAQGEALGWGFQLQSPQVVSVLTLVFLALALNLSGVFQMGIGLQSLAGDLRLRDDRLDALCAGILAAVVASPCTAPFMGSALGYAITRPAYEAIAVFAMLGVGMALPYLLLCLMPGAIRKLPRPGPWMETLKQFLAFPLYATAVWLVWVLARQRGVDAAAHLLFAGVLMACALWLWGHGRKPWQAMISAILLVSAAWLAWPRPEAKPQTQAWLPWTAQAVERSLASGQPVFVDFTAAWCVTCQFNKRLVLNTGELNRQFMDKGVVRLQADWTNRDPDISVAMGRLGRNGVPIYALYVPGEVQPRLLPEILTPRIVLDALAALPVRVSGTSRTPTED